MCRDSVLSRVIPQQWHDIIICIPFPTDLIFRTWISISRTWNARLKHHGGSLEMFLIRHPNPTQIVICINHFITFFTPEPFLVKFYVLKHCHDVNFWGPQNSSFFSAIISLDIKLFFPASHISEWENGAGYQIRGIRQQFELQFDNFRRRECTGVHPFLVLDSCRPIATHSRLHLWVVLSENRPCG